MHRLLKRNDNQWTKKALLILIDMNIGWGKSIIEALNEYELPTEFSWIQSFTERQWTTIVRQKIETKNKKRLYEDCHKIVNGNPTPKTIVAKALDGQRYPLPLCEFMWV